MALMKSPYTSKPVEVPEASIARYEASGFVVVTAEEPESEAPKKASAPASRRTTAKKSPAKKKTTETKSETASRNWLDDK